MAGILLQEAEADRRGMNVHYIKRFTLDTYHHSDEKNIYSFIVDSLDKKDKEKK
jgi:hypothetical protein